MAASTEAGAGAFPAFVAYRNSATPSPNDIIASYVWRGKDGGDNDTDYAAIRAVILDQNDGSEDSNLILTTILVGVANNVLTLGGGVQVGSPTDGDKGTGTWRPAAQY